MPGSSTRAVPPTPFAANDDIRRQPLRAAVLSARPARLLAALEALDFIAIDAARADLALLLRDAPDLLVVDIEPGTVSARRLALLVAQLGWARRDLVIAVAQGRTAALGGLAFDMTFDPGAPDAALHDSLSDARSLLAHSRLRPAAAKTAMPGAPALLRRAAARRASLFR
jgi:hypothetical protein